MERFGADELELPRHVFAVRNPVATHAEAAQHHITQLAGDGMSNADVMTFETQDVSREENRQLFMDRLTHAWYNGFIVPEKTWIAVAGGDGTLGNIAEALVNADEELRALPILPIGVGNANDVAHSLHGPLGIHYLSRYYHRTQLTKVRPLQCTIEAPGSEPQVHTALGYVSFGASARAAQAINTNRNSLPIRQLPGIRQGHEAAISLRALRQAGAFELEETDEYGVIQTRTLTDRLFVNGRHMAKYLRFPVELTQDTYFTTDVRAHTVGSIVVTAAKMAAGRHKGKVMQPYGAHTFAVRSPTMLQVDGEVYDVPANTTISVAPVPAEKALTFASVRTP